MSLKMIVTTTDSGDPKIFDANKGLLARAREFLTWSVRAMVIATLFYIAGLLGISFNWYILLSVIAIMVNARKV